MKSVRLAPRVGCPCVASQFAMMSLASVLPACRFPKFCLTASTSFRRRFVCQSFRALKDAAGKDGTITHVMSGATPQGCQVYSFKSPSAKDLDHDYLWRCMKCLPNRGHIGIFNTGTSASLIGDITRKCWWSGSIHIWKSRRSLLRSVHNTYGKSVSRTFALLKDMSAETASSL